MKILYFLTVFFISFQLLSQTEFTDALAGELPNSIQIVGEDMFVSTFASQKLYRIALSDPSNPITVANFSLPLLKVAYSQPDNDMYVLSVKEFLSVDLDQSFPVTPVKISDLDDSNGLSLNNNIVYIADGNEIYTYDINVGSESYNLLYSEAQGEIRNPAFYNDDLYFQVFDNVNGLSLGIYKISTTSSTPTKVLVSSNSPNGVLQSSHITAGFLYLGFESPNNLVRVDLSNSTLPIDSDTVFSDLGAGVLGLASKGETVYYTTGQQIIYSFNDSVLNIEELIQMNGILYPNPANKYINLANDMGINSFQIYSISGIPVKSGQEMDRIDVSHLASGLYFIKFKNDKSENTFKFIKE